MSDKAIVVNKLNAYARSAFGDTKKQLLFDINFSVPRGKICTFIGHNGAGKTTTVKTILGLRPTSSPGKITLLDKDFKDIAARKKIGYIPEKGSLEKIKAIDFLRNIGLFYGLNKKECDNKALKILKHFNLQPDRLQVKMNKLSSGQNKDIILSQAFLGEPELIIADEPTDNLDPSSRDLFWEFVEHYHKQHPQTTFFLITHNLDEVEKYTDYIVVLDHGYLIYEGKYDRSPGLRDKYRVIRNKYSKISTNTPPPRHQHKTNL